MGAAGRAYATCWACGPVHDERRHAEVAELADCPYYQAQNGWRPTEGAFCGTRKCHEEPLCLHLGPGVRPTDKPDSRPDAGSALLAALLLGLVLTALLSLAFLAGEHRRCDALREQGSALVERYCGTEAGG
jgi:hypothetical protein